MSAAAVHVAQAVAELIAEKLPAPAAPAPSLPDLERRNADLRDANERLVLAALAAPRKKP